MHEDLIKRLRDAAKMSEALAVLLPHSEGNATAKLMYDAADAIEELQKQRDEWESHAALAESFARGWIPVTERLPEKEKKTYLVYTDTGYQCVCRWTNDLFGIGETGNWGWRIFDIRQYCEVTHWMPLPEPPKEEET